MISSSNFFFRFIFGVAVLLLTLGLLAQPASAQSSDSVFSTDQVEDPIELSLNTVFDDLRRQAVEAGENPDVLSGSSGLVLRDFSLTVGYTANYYHVLKRGGEYWASSMGHYAYLEGQIHLGTWDYTRVEVGIKIFGEAGWFHLSGDARYSSNRRLEGGQFYVIIRDVYETPENPSYGSLKLGFTAAHTWEEGESGGSGTYRQRYDTLQLGAQAELTLNFPFRVFVEPDSQVTAVRNQWRQTIYSGWFPETRISAELARDSSIHARQSFVDSTTGNRISSDGRNRNTRYVLIVDQAIYRFVNETSDIREESLHSLDPFVRFQFTANSAFGYRTIRDSSSPSSPHFVNTFGVGIGFNYRLTLEDVQIGIQVGGVYTYEDRGLAAPGPDRGAGNGFAGLWVNF